VDIDTIIFLFGLSDMDLNAFIVRV